jgi:hypothetical protein
VPAVVSDYDPVPDHLIAPTQAVKFTLTGAPLLSAVLISVNDVVIYFDETARGGYTVVRTSLGGSSYRYEVSPPIAWPYAAQLTFGVFSDSAARWTLWVDEDPTCFVGPPNSFEQSLLLPYDHWDSTLRSTDQLRTLLLDLAIDRPQVNRAVRWLFLRAHSNDLAPVLRTLVPTPTSIEAAVHLCRQRSNLVIDTALRGKPGLLTAVIGELQTLGLPAMHADLLRRYDIDDPNLRVPMSCLAVCLAKVLETGGLAG